MILPLDRLSRENPNIKILFIAFSFTLYFQWLILSVVNFSLLTLCSDTSNEFVIHFILVKDLCLCLVTSKHHS